jgi:hypothetical protein
MRLISRSYASLMPAGIYQTYEIPANLCVQVDFYNLTNSPTTASLDYLLNPVESGSLSLAKWTQQKAPRAHSTFASIAQDRANGQGSYHTRAQRRTGWCLPGTICCGPHLEDPSTSYANVTQARFIVVAIDEGILIVNRFY